MFLVVCINKYMKMKKKKVVLLVAIATMFACYNVYEARKIKQFPELLLMNLDALATDGEYGSPCVEWVTKPCYTDFFSGMSDSNGYNASCSGGSSVVGGMLECGAVTNRLPMYPYEGKKCLECVRTADGGEVG